MEGPSAESGSTPISKASQQKGKLRRLISRSRSRKLHSREEGESLLLEGPMSSLSLDEVGASHGSMRSPCLLQPCHAVHVCRIQREARLMASLGGKRTHVGQGGRDLWSQVGCHDQLSAEYTAGLHVRAMYRLQACKASGM